MTARPEDTVRGERIRLAIQRTEVAEGDSWREDAVRELDALLAELAACRERAESAERLMSLSADALERLRHEHERAEALLADARQALAEIEEGRWDENAAPRESPSDWARRCAREALARLDAGERE